jgi:hypothetical protein
VVGADYGVPPLSRSSTDGLTFYHDRVIMPCADLVCILQMVGFCYQTVDPCPRTRAIEGPFFSFLFFIVGDIIGAGIYALVGQVGA